MVIILPQLLKSTVIAEYTFSWDDQKTISAIALGYGSLYNHSNKPNAWYQMNHENRYDRVLQPAVHRTSPGDHNKLQRKSLTQIHWIGLMKGGLCRMDRLHAEGKNLQQLTTVPDIPVAFGERSFVRDCFSRLKRDRNDGTGVDKAIFRIFIRCKEVDVFIN